MDGMDGWMDVSMDGWMDVVVARYLYFHHYLIAILTYDHHHHPFVPSFVLMGISRNLCTACTNSPSPSSLQL